MAVILAETNPPAHAKLRVDVIAFDGSEATIRIAGANARHQIIVAKRDLLDLCVNPAADNAAKITTI